MDKEAQEKIRKSDAKATIESSIISGLSERAHLTGANINKAHIQVPDILNAIFHPSVRWAVTEYLGELGYHKLPKDKPPLLSDNPYEEFGSRVDEFTEDALHDIFEDGKQAQREADIRYYEH